VRESDRNFSHVPDKSMEWNPNLCREFQPSGYGKLYPRVLSCPDYGHSDSLYQCDRTNADQYKFDSVGLADLQAWLAAI
jgi:hypothetical protein